MTVIIVLQLANIVDLSLRVSANIVPTTNCELTLQGSIITSLSSCWCYVSFLDQHTQFPERLFSRFVVIC